jgi:hypothetical protein
VPEAEKFTVKFVQTPREAVRTGSFQIRRQRLSVGNTSREKAKQRCDLVGRHFGSIDQASEIVHPGGICGIVALSEMDDGIGCVA